jgi:hypothetical protein
LYHVYSEENKKETRESSQSLFKYEKKGIARYIFFSLLPYNFFVCFSFFFLFSFYHTYSTLCVAAALNRQEKEGGRERGVGVEKRKRERERENENERKRE